jgi:type II secretory pathway pseudopilin PulG
VVVKKIKASSLAEMVIALSIISIALVVVSRVFVQVNRSTIQFREVKAQSEFQNLVYEALVNDTLPNLSKWKNDEMEIKFSEPSRENETKKAYWIESYEKKLWQQEFGNE